MTITSFYPSRWTKRTRWIQCRVPEVVPVLARVPERVRDLDRLEVKEGTRVPKEVIAKEKVNQKLMVQCTEVLKPLRHRNRYAKPENKKFNFFREIEVVYAKPINYRIICPFQKKIFSGVRFSLWIPNDQPISQII